MAINETKATCTFVAEDVLDMFDVTEAEAEEFLFNNQKHIQDRMCELGWEVIECFGEMDGLKKKDAYAVNAEPGFPLDAESIGSGFDDND
jgi:hypothetical protein